MSCPAGALRRAAFLDRDGVINVDHGYVGRWEDFEFVPGAVEAMRRLHQAGYLLVVVTNQSGIARGFYSEAQFQALSLRMQEALSRAGAPLAGVFHCPHHPEAVVPALRHECDCRKPAPGLLWQARDALGIDLASSLLVGDKGSDIDAARRAGVARAYRVRHPGDLDKAQSGAAEDEFIDLATCVAKFLSPGV
jgi:D-glycero-D-manno-heptose 1,7-bisphosphate phosphatase